MVSTVPHATNGTLLNILGLIQAETGPICLLAGDRE